MRLTCIFLFLAATFLFNPACFAQPDLNLTSYTNVGSPVDITGAGDGSGRLFIVGKSGVIRIYDQNTSALLSGNFLNITSQVSNSGEKGLLGLTFHPQFATNGYFYVNYVTTGSPVTKISRFTASPPSSNSVNPATELVLLSIPQPFDNHNAGDLAFGPDGYLYVPLGDGGSGGDPNNRAQNPQDLLGKMLRIDVDNPANGNNYGIPSTNPYIGTQVPTDYRDEIWDLGLRNPWRISFDRGTGDLWIADVGQGAWEEVNFQPAGSSGGGNYGWRCYEGNHNYNTSGCSSMSSYKSPIFEYGHNPTTGGNSISGGFVYRGTDSPSLQGWYVMADYTSDNFWLIGPNGSGWTTDLQTNVPVVDIVTFGEDDDGELYAGSLGGQIYKVGASAPMPIELIQFKADLLEDRVQLHWTTATEKNGAYFQVERKTEGRDYETIGTVMAAGESVFHQNYSFDDLLAEAGTNIYRLKMVDLDNSFEYSQALSVLIDKSGNWQLFPNPTTGTVSLQMDAGDDVPALQFTVQNVQGNTVFYREETEPAFPYRREIDLRDLPAGIYFCRLDAGEKTEFKRLVVR